MPLATVSLVLANLLGYLLELAAGGQASCASHGLVPARFVASGDATSLLSHLFLHDPNGWTHIVGNMIFLTVFGTVVESEVGHLATLALFVCGGVMGGLLHVAIDPTTSIPMVGCSGSVFALAAVAAAIDPRRWLMFVITLAGWNVWLLLSNSSDGTSFGTHIGGFVTGTGFSLIRIGARLRRATHLCA